MSRNLAIAVSVAVHVLVFLALLWNFGTVPTYSEPPVMNVELARPFSRRPPPVPVPAVSTKPERARATADLPVLSQPAPTPDAVAAVPQPPEAADESVRLRNALRSRAGCDQAALLNLSPAERQACLDRMAKAPNGDRPPGLNLDMRGGYAKNPTPYLIRKPHNGCKVGAGGDSAPSGDRGTAAGVKCAWSF